MFSGFSAEAIRFLRGLKKNNTREWFQARKETFEQECKAPMEALVEAVNGSLVRFAPGYMTEPKKAMFRIYRDTRFANDKTPYKTHLGAWFGLAGLEGKSAAGFYFHLSGEEFVTAGGCYMPPPDQLLAIRKHLLEHHDRYRKIESSKRFRDLHQFEGASLSRDPKGFPKDHPAGDLIRRKQWGWHSSIPIATAQTAQLTGEVRRRFEALAPMVDFLNEPFRVRKGARSLTFD
jgi:uncharacterized protein (TIGR02453 family)